MTAHSVRWRIQLLNGLIARRDDRTIERFATRRASVLLAYLTLYPQRQHSREALMEMLWPEEDPDATRLRFRQTLTILRHALETAEDETTPIVLADRHFVRLNPEAATSDVAEFETLTMTNRADTRTTRREKLEQAIALYAGELLPGYYEDWVLSERIRLHDTYLGALTNLAKTWAELGNPQAGLGYAQKAVALDPLRENLHTDLIELYLQAGNVPEALRTYRSLEQTLWKELRVLPSPETQALIASARSGRVALVEPSIAIADTESSTENGERSAPESVTPSSNSLSQRGSSEGDNFSTPLPLEGGRDNPVGLAASLTPFFGREQEIAHLTGMLTESRLVTLLGTGGSGKTRLSQEVARIWSAQGAEVVWFVPLAEVRDAASLMDAIANTLSADRTASEDSLRRVYETLSRQPSLLVLDNFEQVTQIGGPMVKTLLERVPGLRCLVTSRQALHITGERTYALLPLPAPDPAEAYATLTESPSVRLFVDRARNVQPDFLLTPENAPVIATLCQNLEGIPLAIELAAAWSSVFSPAQMLERLSNRFALLVSHQEDVPSRHRSLRATIEDSYTQLAPTLQRFFAALSIFRGSWTLEAAEAVCATSQAFDYLAQLQRYALALREPADPADQTVRFRMLETLREFARDQVSAEEEKILRERHATYYLQLAECAGPHLVGPEQSLWFERLQRENDNLRAAMEWCVGEEGDLTIGLRMVANLWRFWDVRCHRREGAAWVNALLARCHSLSPEQQAHALEDAGNFASAIRDLPLAQERLEACLQLYRELGDTRGIGHVLTSLAVVLRDRGEVQKSKPLFEESLAIVQERKDALGMARALGGLGIIAWVEKEYVTAHAFLEQSGALYRIVGHRKAVAWCHYHRGEVAREQGDIAGCLALFQEGIPISRVLQDADYLLYALYNIGYAQQALGDRETAWAVGKEALQIARDSGMTDREVIFLLWLGDLSWDKEETALARTYYRQALERSGQVQLEIGIVSALKRFAGLAAREGQLARATRLLAASETLNQGKGLDVPHEDTFLARFTPHPFSPSPDGPTLRLLQLAEAQGRVMTASQTVMDALENNF